MRRTIATILVTGFLFSAVPFARSSGPGDDFEGRIIQIIKKFVRHLIPAPTDGGDQIGGPKP